MGGVGAGSVTMSPTLLQGVIVLTCCTSRLGVMGGSIVVSMGLNETFFFLVRGVLLMPWMTVDVVVRQFLMVASFWACRVIVLDC